MKYNDKDVKIRVEIVEMDYEPYEFTPFEGYFKVFRNADTKEIIGCGNLIFDCEMKETTYIFIKFIEAYGNGYGRAIINYLMNENKKVIIAGDSLDDAVGFWQRMGANIDENNDDFPFILKK